MKKYKSRIKSHYSRIASKGNDGSVSSCNGEGSNCKGKVSGDYSSIKGYYQRADYGLGCGLPTQFITITPGQVVLDLGSGAGNDCFVARELVGETGRVIGLDFSEAMVERAKENLKRLGHSNMEFLVGDIEDIPLPANSIDVVISNCVLNLIPNKDVVLNNIYRVLKPGGCFAISDIVTDGPLSDNWDSLADPIYRDCINGTLQKDIYLEKVQKVGFKDVVVHKTNEIPLYGTSGAGLDKSKAYSMTLSGMKNPDGF